MTLILDAGALVALERDDRAMWLRLRAALLDGEPPLTHGGVVAQVWRGGGGRQTRLACALHGVDVVALDERLGRLAGELLRRAGRTDVIDAAVVLLANDDDQIVTSDADDIQRLVSDAGTHVDVIPV